MSVRAMLARVQRLEQSRSPSSPFVRAYGSLEAFANEMRAGIAAGGLDATDMPVVILAVERWHREVWVL